MAHHGEAEMTGSKIWCVAAGILATFGLCAARAGAQCTEGWLPGEGLSGVDGDGAVIASVTWDPDGPGPQAPVLVIAGSIWAAGGVLTPGIAAWNGHTWSALSQSGVSAYSL